MCSNSVRSTVDTMARLALIDQYFEFTLSNEDVAKPKPDPEIYATAIDRIGTTPARTLIVEDNHHGIAAAEAVGAHVMAVGGPNDVTYPIGRAAWRAREGQCVSYWVVAGSSKKKE